MTLEDHQKQEICGEEAENDYHRPNDVDLRLLDAYLHEKDADSDLYKARRQNVSNLPAIPPLRDYQKT
jgi:hypothetical protein